MTQLTRRGLLAGAAGVGTAALLGGQWPRLTGGDIPGRRDDSLQIAILGTNQDAAARQSLVEAFNVHHPDIPVRLQAVQGTDWADFFAKILTMVAAGTSPDVCVVATEGAQLFAERLAEPLDRFVRRDAEEVQDYFDDVHPSLIEAFMYKGSLYQMPIDFNAANMYLSTEAMQRAGVSYPPETWTHEDFLDMARQMRQAGGRGFVPFYWTNRLWGGIVPWLYVNDTSFLTEEKAPGGDWLWDRFYPDHQGAYSGGYLWEGSNASDPRVAESFEFVRALVEEGLGTSPAQGGGNELVGQFSGGSIGMTPAGGFWVEGLNAAGLTPEDYDVTYFPAWRSQRHQFGASGYAVLRTSQRQDEAWEWVKFCTSLEGMQLAFPAPSTTPTRRSMCNEDLYTGKGPAHWKVFYDTLDRFPCVPIPAPPQQAAVETALIKNVLGAVTGSAAALPAALERLDADLSRALEA
ncbi:extracellular solute-binding protein [Actinomyces sp. 2119]|uniref:Extracellular solute-binding protein n=1 Tax=Actinomyces lilanjuaniae TaxID=2321394 RepID=A0ABN5PUB5_9ACTO|nr:MULTISPECIES: extracellular solute-binding protein [Actinomyces]AYD90620.1 extracellular solute-binding protein [Actinomyces lilanjuaniae]RJF43923.1 extracellular solute-binding protein [Actinomyces sp. 2119]